MQENVTFCSPEQVYAKDVTLYGVLTGLLPFQVLSGHSFVALLLAKQTSQSLMPRWKIYLFLL